MDTITSVVNTPSDEIASKTFVASTYLPKVADADVNFGSYGLTLNDLNISGQTASRIASFDASKNVISLDTATYPSLAELAYVKGVTSAIQTQLTSKWNNNGTSSATADWSLGAYKLTANALETNTTLKIIHNSTNYSTFDYSFFEGLVIDIVGSNSYFAMKKNGTAIFEVIDGQGYLLGDNPGLYFDDIDFGTRGYVGFELDTGVFGLFDISDKNIATFDNATSTYEYFNGSLYGTSSAITSSVAITSSSFVKSGGTSSQFLKADGSVDSSTYITSSALTPYWKNDGTSTATGNWNLSGYNLNDVSNMFDSTNVLSISPNSRIAYEADGTTVAIDWSGTYPFGVYINTLQTDNIFGVSGSLVQFGSAGDVDILARDIESTTTFKVNGTSGFTGTGAYTNFTIEGGIITSAS